MHPLDSSFNESLDEVRLNADNLNLITIPNFDYEEFYSQEVEERQSEVDYEKDKSIAKYEQIIKISLDDYLISKPDKKKTNKPILKNTIKLIEGITDFNLIKNTNEKNCEFPENQRFFMRKRKAVDYSMQDKLIEFDLNSEENSSVSEKGNINKKDNK